MNLIWDPDAARGHTADGYVVELVIGEASGKPLVKMTRPCGTMTASRAYNPEDARAWGERNIAEDRASREHQDAMQPQAA